MRDPLARLPVRYKLTSGFVALCLVAYGIGAWLVSAQARDALREQILARLSAEARLQASRLDAALETALLRARDFASDGLVREQATRLPGRDAEPDPTHAEVLERHLAENKLPIVPAFAALEVRGADGYSAVRVGRPIPARAPVPDEGVGAAAWEPGPPGRAYVPVVVPLLDLGRTRRVGALVCWVDLGRLASEALVVPSGSHAELLQLLEAHGPVLTLSAPAASGGGWTLASQASDDRAGRPGALSYAWPLKAAGWSVRTQVDPTEALAPVSRVEARFLVVGVGVALLTAGLLFFPLRFLVRPLARLREAALHITAGEIPEHVPVESEDEVGDLARAFNVMADAVRERTTRLEQAAADLAVRKDELGRERDRLEAMVRSMQDALVFLDNDGRVVLSNAAAAPLVAVLEGPEGRDLAVRCSAHAEAGSERDCVACLARDRMPRQACRLEAGGRIYEVRASRIPSAGTWLGRLLVARDVTEQVALDERSAHQERLAVLGEVAAVVAHELNNPLSAIAMYAQMMEAELPEGSGFREHVTVIRRNTEVCSRTIRGLLDWAWHAEPQVADVNLDELLDEVSQFVRPLLHRAGVALGREPALEDPVVYADGLQLRQVLVNLVINGIQAAEGGGGHVTLATGTEADGLRVWVEVRDDGPGVPPERRERIFEPFFTTKPAGRGTGLGLPIARRLVEAHSGTLTLRSAAPGATVFRMELPRRALVDRRRSAGVGAAP